ncbi:MAG: cytochrome C oxidase subunit IV family protein [Mariniblastus sp.]
MNETDAINRDATGNSNTKVFLFVFLMLCALTGISFWVANSYLMENRVVGWSAMMLVSVAKALLVILFFMHLWWERAWKYVLTIPALFMGVLLVLLLVPDVGYRYLTYSKDRRENAPKPVVGDMIDVNPANYEIR